MRIQFATALITVFLVTFFSVASACDGMDKSKGKATTTETEQSTKK